MLIVVHQICEWMGGFVYKENGVLDYVHTHEGRVVRNTAGAFEYEYHYTDQVGSLRLAWRAQNSNGTWIAAPTEVYNYYPYGLRIPQQAGTPTTAHTYPYRFTGQWNETALGLNYYHFEARLYDPALGRWTGVDPMASVNASYSPYNYVLGNPVNLIDPDGRMQMIPDYNPSSSELAAWAHLMELSSGRGGGGSGAFSGWLSGSGFGSRDVFALQQTWAVQGQMGGVGLLGAQAMEAQYNRDRNNWLNGTVNVGGVNGRWLLYDKATYYKYKPGSAKKFVVSENSDLVFAFLEAEHFVYVLNAAVDVSGLGHVGVAFQIGSGNISLFSANGTDQNMRAYGPQTHPNVGYLTGDVYSNLTHLKEERNNYTSAYRIKVTMDQYNAALEYATSNADQTYSFTNNDCLGLVCSTLRSGNVSNGSPGIAYLFPFSVLPTLIYDLTPNLRYMGSALDLWMAL